MIPTSPGSARTRWRSCRRPLAPNRRRWLPPAKSKVNPMQQAGDWGLDAAIAAGASYADVRVGETRHRTLATKNGKLGHAADSDSQGIGIRVVVQGAWGFASSDDLSREAVIATARRAVAIAQASAQVRQANWSLAPEPVHQAVWVAPCA